MAAITNDENSTILQQYDGDRVAVAERWAYMKVAIRELREELENLKIQHRDEVKRLEGKIENLDHACETRAQNSVNTAKTYVNSFIGLLAKGFHEGTAQLRAARRAAGLEIEEKDGVEGKDGGGDAEMDEASEVASVPIKMGIIPQRKY